MTAPLSVTFLWHMHQPCYKDPVRSEYALPWTYLHGVKDYYDMAAIVAETPGARATFNLVPSLLDQLLDYAAGTVVDPFLIRGQMAPADMSEEDRLFVVENFFAANRQRMVEPSRRYRELLLLAGQGEKGRSADRLRHIGPQEMLDLQVWFFLAWTGVAARRRYPELEELVRKGRNFTASDKELLFARHLDILNGIVPLYRRLHEEGKVELAVSPYFHPILPLLCDMKSALTAMPRANLPATRFRHPEDARSQVVAAVARFREIFGFAPRGMWPSEGSVSDDALAIIAESGIQWVATDEEILARTLAAPLGHNRERLYHPYVFQNSGRELRMLFRDHYLSDLIGFTFAQMETGRAVSQFVSKLREIRQSSPGARVVPIILDGENAWEYYQENGHDFLARLYAAIAGSEGLELATCSEALEANPVGGVLPHIHPGSWINADYGIWVGHPEENLGWDYIERAREAAVSRNPEVARILADSSWHLPPSGEADRIAREICRSLYAAEGSDWFWWYGDDHFSSDSDRFDLLFRRHLMHVYQLLGMEIPRELYEPIKKKSPAGLIREPAALISPTINGQVDGYFEWLAAGLYDLTRQSSAMHAAESLLQSFFYGYDRKALFFRLDGEKGLEHLLQQDDQLILHLFVEREYRLQISRSATSGPLLVKEGSSWRPSGSEAHWQTAHICEICVPLTGLGLEPKGRLAAIVTLVRNGSEAGSWPTDGQLPLVYTGPDLELENWLI